VAPENDAHTGHGSEHEKSSALDHSALKHRLVELPAEIEREAVLIAARYPRLFAVAMSYLVPAALARVR
jgi:hypothetical protein